MMPTRSLLFGPAVLAALVSVALVAWRSGTDFTPIHVADLAFMASSVVTPQKSQSFAIQVPQAVADDSLQLVVLASAWQPPKGGGMSFVVRLRPTPGVPTGEVEVGRFGIFPTEAFTALRPTEMRRFGFSMTKALHELGVAHGSMEVVDAAEQSRKGGDADLDQGQLTVTGVFLEPIKKD